jgi:hypothetical protein
MPKGVNKGVRALAKKAGVSPALVTRKKNQGKSDEQIIEEARIREAKPPKHDVTKHTGETYGEAQARKESHLANLRAIDEAQKLEQLLSAPEVEAKWAEVGTKVKDETMALPTRIVNRLPDEWRREVFTVVTEEVRRVLNAISNEFMSDQQTA